MSKGRRKDKAKGRLKDKAKGRLKGKAKGSYGFSSPCASFRPYLQLCTTAKCPVRITVIALLFPAF